MNVIKFCGKDKRSSVKKAISFFYDNFEDENLQVFLAKCRVQKDGKTIFYYPDWSIDLDKIKKLKKEKGTK